MYLGSKLRHQGSDPFEGNPLSEDDEARYDRVIVGRVEGEVPVFGFELRELVVDFGDDLRLRHRCATTGLRT